MEESKVQVLSSSSPKFKMLFSKKPPISNTNTCCHICTVQFSALVKRNECSVCKKGVCKEHIFVRTAMTLMPICDDCEKDRIRKEVAKEMTPQYKALKGDMNWLIKEKEKFKTEMAAKNEIISRLEIQEKNNEKSYLQRLDNIEKKMEEENQREKTVQNVIDSLKNALNESKTSETQMKQKLDTNSDEIKEEIQGITILKSEEEKLLFKTDEINKEIRNMILAKEIKAIACKKCYDQLKIKFSERLKQALANENRESLLSSFFSRASIRPTRNLQRNMQEPMTRDYCKQCLMM